MDKKNICFLCGNLSRGGGTEQVTSLISNELCKYYNIFIVDIMNDDSECYYSFNNAITIIHIKLHKKFSMLRKMLDLFEIFHKNKINIVINVDIMLIMYSFFPAKINHTKIISWEQFNYYNDIGSKNTRKIRQFCLKYTDYYINLTKQDLNIFQDKFKVRIPTTYIYNPIDKINDSIYDINSKLLVTAGNFYNSKGYDMCLKIGEEIFPKHPDWKWMFCGDGLEFENIKKQISESKYNNNFIFTGRVKNIDHYMQIASMYVSTSRNEGFGLVLIEAQNNSLPIVAFDVPFGPNEIIIQNVNGYLIQPFDIHAMASKINNLIENQDLRVRLSKNSKIKFNDFDKKNIIIKWRNIIEEI